MMISKNWLDDGVDDRKDVGKDDTLNKLNHIIIVFNYLNNFISISFIIVQILQYIELVFIL